MTPYPGPQSVIVMDNARIHKSPEVIELIHSHGMSYTSLSSSTVTIVGCRVEYLAPYSPDHNPIEQAFSVIKAHLQRSGIHLFMAKEAYYELYLATKVVTPEMTWGFFRHSGYL